MKKLLTLTCLTALSLLAEPGHALLLPQGDAWMCDLIPGLVGCSPAYQHLSMLQVEAIPGAVGFDWKVEVSTVDGKTTVLKGYQSATPYSHWIVPSLNTGFFRSFNILIAPHMGGVNVLTESK